MQAQTQTIKTATKAVESPIQRVKDNVYVLSDMRIAWINEQEAYLSSPIATYKIEMDGFAFYVRKLNEKGNWVRLKGCPLRAGSFVLESNKFYLETQVNWSDDRRRDGEVAGRDFMTDQNGRTLLKTSSGKWIDDRRPTRYFDAIESRRLKDRLAEMIC